MVFGWFFAVCLVGCCSMVGWLFCFCFVFVWPQPARVASFWRSKPPRRVRRTRRNADDRATSSCRGDFWGDCVFFRGYLMACLCLFRPFRVHFMIFYFKKNLRQIQVVFMALIITSFCFFGEKNIGLS